MTEQRKPPLVIEKDGAPEYAILPWDEYQALATAAEEGEDMWLLAAVDADETEEQLPAEMVRRLVAGESPVRVWREYRGLKGKELAQMAGIEQSYVSQIEKGKRTGSLDVMRRIAGALGVTLDDLFPV